MRTLRSRRVLLGLGALLIGLAIVVTAVAALSVRVLGPSMEPTLRDGDRVLLRPFSGGDRPGRFAVVLTRTAERGPQVLKRVVGLPGDRVEVAADGAVRVQPGGAGPWFVVEHPAWRDAPPARPVAPTEVPDGAVFLLGDNAAVSSDSRDYGPVPIEFIRGTVWLRTFPPGRWGTPGGGVRLVPAP